MLGGAAFALARMAPRRYERLADAGAATGVIDPLLVRAYLRAGRPCPPTRPGRRPSHTGAALHLFAAGVAHRVVKADVASLYPSLMRAYRIGPARDHLGAMLALVDRPGRAAAAGEGARRGAPRRLGRAVHARGDVGGDEARGQLGLRIPRGGRRADAVRRRRTPPTRSRVAAASCSDLLCRELAARGVTLLEADTDGVYFAVPDVVDARPTSGAWSPRWPRCCRRWCSSSSRAATRRCCRTSPRTTRCCTYDGDAAAARRRLSLEPRGALRRGLPARARSARCWRATSRRARRVSRHGGRAAPARTADVRRLVARAPDQDAGAVPARPGTPGAS